MEHPEKNFNEIVRRINEDLPLHSMWDGFWVHIFRRKNLVISCSFDRIYYRNYDLIFKDVIFFNVPDEWRDTDVHGEDLLRLADREEFSRHQPDFDPGDHLIFAIDLHLGGNDPQHKHTFFVLGKHIYLDKCADTNCNPVPEYTDPLAGEPYPCKRNRVGVK